MGIVLSCGIPEFGRQAVAFSVVPVHRVFYLAFKVGNRSG